MDVTAVVLAYGEQPYLYEVVDRVLASTGVTAQVVVVDNGCTGPSLDPLRDRPGVTLLEPGTNTGFTGGCNLGAAATDADFLAFINSDALVEPGALAALVAVAARPEVGLASASLRLAATPELLNTDGNPVHVLGLSWAGHLGEPASSYATEKTITSATGAAVAVRREVWDALGGFTEEFFAYCEDADLSLRCWQQGWDVVYVPDAVVLHHYEFGRNPAKFYLLERNRLAMVLSLYQARTLLLLAPVFLAFEVAMMAVAGRRLAARQAARLSLAAAGAPLVGRAPARRPARPPAQRPRAGAPADRPLRLHRAAAPDGRGVVEPRHDRLLAAGPPAPLTRGRRSTPPVDRRWSRACPRGYSNI